MSKQQVIDPRNETWKAYQKQLTVVKASKDESSSLESEYWWALWTIFRDELWRADGEEKFVDWLGWFTVQPFGDSQGAFYDRMNAIKNWQTLGFTTAREIKYLLKNYKMAIGPDLKRLMDTDGFKPEIEEQIQGANETPKEFVRRVAELGKGEARKEVLGKVYKNRFFFHRDGAVFDKKRQIIMANLQWEHEDEGIKGIYTLSLKCTNTETGEVEMSPEVAQWLASKLGFDFTEA